MANISQVLNTEKGRRDVLKRRIYVKEIIMIN